MTYWYAISVIYFKSWWFDGLPLLLFCLVTLIDIRVIQLLILRCIVSTHAICFKTSRSSSFYNFSSSRPLLLILFLTFNVVQQVHIPSSPTTSQILPSSWMTFLSLPRYSIRNAVFSTTDRLQSTVLHHSFVVSFKSFFNQIYPLSRPFLVFSPSQMDCSRLSYILKFINSNVHSSDIRYQLIVFLTFLAIFETVPYVACYSPTFSTLSTFLICKLS